MYVYDALSKVRSDIEKRKRNHKIAEVAKAGGLGLLATALGFFVWLGLLIAWSWIWN